MNYDNLKDKIRSSLSLKLKKPYDEIEILLNQIMYFIRINANNVKHKTSGNLKESNLFESFSFDFNGDVFKFVLHNNKTKYEFFIPRTDVY